MSDPYDAILDARSEALYGDGINPQAEPDIEEVKERAWACYVDESAGLAEESSWRKP